MIYLALVSFDLLLVSFSSYSIFFFIAISQIDDNKELFITYSSDSYRPAYLAPRKFTYSCFFDHLFRFLSAILYFIEIVFINNCFGLVGFLGDMDQLCKFGLIGATIKLQWF